MSVMMNRNNVEQNIGLRPLFLSGELVWELG